MKALILQDPVDARLLGLLAKAGFDCHVAPSIDEATQILFSLRPEIIFLDQTAVQKPGRIMRMQSTPTVVVSSVRSPEDAALALADGADEWLCMEDGDVAMLERLAVLKARLSSPFPHTSISLDQQLSHILLQSISQPIALLNCDGQILFMNQAALDKLGLDSLEQARTTMVWDLASGISRTPEQWQWMLERLPQQWKGTVEHLDRSGKVVRTTIDICKVSSSTRRADRYILVTAGSEAEQEDYYNALQTNYRLFYDVVCSTADMTWTLDRDGIILHASASLIRRLNRLENEVIGQPFQSLVALEDRDFAIRFLRNNLERHHVGPFEMRLIRLDGPDIPVEVISSETIGRFGEVTGVQSVLREISKRVVLEQALERRVAVQELLSEISSRLFSLDQENCEDCVISCLKEFAEFAGVDHCYVSIDSSRLDSNRTKSERQIFSWVRPGIGAFVQFKDITEHQLPYMAQLIKNRQTIYVNRLDDLPPEAAADRRLLESIGIRSHLSVPIERGGKVIGAVALGSATKEILWPNHVVGAMRILGDLFATTLIRRQMMSELRESEERYRVLVEHALDGIVVISGERFIYANTAFQQMVQLQPDEVKTVCPSEFFSLADLRAGMTSQSTPPEDSHQHPLKIHRRDGAQLEALFSAESLLFNGQRATVAILKDVTALGRLLETDRSFKALVEHAPIGIALLLGDKAFYANPAQLKMLGYTEEEYAALPLEDLLDDSELGRSLVLPRYKARMAGEDVPSWYEVHMKHKDGSTVHMLCSVAKVEMRGQMGVIVMHQDISEIKQAEIQLRQAQTDLETRVVERTEQLYRANAQLQREVSERAEAEKRLVSSLNDKEALLREVYHRVKNNLQIIVSLLHLQQDYMHEPQTERLIHDIRNRVFSMGLVHEILCDSKDISDIDLGNYLQTLSSNLLYSYLGDSDHVQLEVQCEPVLLSIDSAIALGLIVNELVSNALKHAFPKPMSGSISIDLRRNEQQRLVLTVTDDGVGLPPGLDPVKTESLGLQLVQELTQQLEGSVHVRNGNGTTFVVEIGAT